MLNPAGASPSLIMNATRANLPRKLEINVSSEKPYTNLQAQEKIVNVMTNVTIANVMMKNVTTITNMVMNNEESNDEDGVQDYSDSDQSDCLDNDPLYSPTPKKKRKKSIPQATETDVELILSTIKSTFPMLASEFTDLLRVQLINSQKKSKTRHRWDPRYIE